MAETKKTTETKTVKSSETKTAAAKTTAAKKTTTTKTAEIKATTTKTTATKTTATKAAETKATTTKAAAEKVAEVKPVEVKVEVKAEKKVDMLKVTLIKSPFGRLENQTRTLKALGLKKTNSSNIVPDNAATRGMIFVVKHLVSVEKV